MFTIAFLKATLERAVKTFAQAEAAFLIAGGTGLLDTDWSTSLSVAGMAAVLSVLTSVGGGAVNGEPSLANETVKPVKASKRNERGTVRLPARGASRDRRLPGKSRIRERRLP